MKKTILSILLVCILALGATAQSHRPPHLQKNGQVTQLIVDDKPFIVLGAELRNNSGTSLEYLQTTWPGLHAMNLNTALIAVSWAQVEPQEGRFDFSIVDGVLAQARENNMRVVLLWFGSWKNTWSSYVPDWVKRDYRRFPRVVLADGTGTERLTPISEANQNQDAKAFAALMRHVKQVDGDRHTVIMIQVQNEVGVIPDARDHSPAAERAFNGPVPRQLMDYLVANRETIAPELRTAWLAAGFKTSGTWAEVFGPGLFTDDLFMSWYYGKYIGAVAKAGKKEYDIPMFANAALVRTNYAPGQYNSGGPLPHSADIWRASPGLDFLAPDIYFGFKEWSDKYVRNGNPLFIPEMGGGNLGAANVFYAIGHNNAIGTSPFGVDRGGPVPAPGTDPMGRSYKILQQLTPLITKHQTTGDVAGVVLESITPSQRVRLGDYELNIQPNRPAGAAAGSVPEPHGIFIRSSSNEFWIAGANITITFKPVTPGDPIAGLATVEEGEFVNGKWVRGRILAGDDTGQGNSVSPSRSNSNILRVELYRYR